MANSLVQGSTSAYLNHIGASNSFFTGTTEVNQGNIRAATSANSLFEMYNTPGLWIGGVEAGAIPSNFETGQFVDVETLSTIDPTADYTCRRNASIITTGGRIQLAISTNNGTPLTQDARFCLYYPSEDFNQEVLAFEYNSTDSSDVNQGNNTQILLDNITGRMKDFVGNNGPTCNGTIGNDLLSDLTSIFRKGCVLTWETAATNGDAILIGPGA